jgi:selenocysteine lyase/cysteine desulfurase
MRCLGVGATARASVGVYNEPADLEALLGALRGAREVFALDDAPTARVA